MAVDFEPLAGTQFYPVESIEVAEFHESNDGSGDPTAVMLILKIEGAEDTPLVMRFKSRPAVDELIVALMTHSKRVWPE